MKALDDLASRLPTTPRQGMLAAALADNIDSDLGGELLIYARESYCPVDDVPEEWGGQPYNTRGRWGARCTCTACNEEFWAGWLKGGGITMTVGEDGSTYTGIPDKNADYGANVVGWPDGDNTYCPLCGSDLKLVHRKYLRCGRTYQLMAGSIERVGDIAIAMSWIVSRRVDEFGVCDVDIRPFGATALLPDGRTRSYRHEAVNAYGGMRTLPGWQASKSNDDPYQVKYYSNEAICSRKFGVWMWSDLPDLAGSTAEKTGLAEYIRGGGCWPVVYLHLWRQRPAVENLMKCGLHRVFISRIAECVSRQASYGLRVRTVDVDDLADFGYRRPRDMMRFTRQEIAECRAWGWTADAASLWMEGVYFGLWSTGAATEFERLRKKYGEQNIHRYVGEVTDGYDFESLDKWDAYLDKQYEKHALPVRAGFELLIDYRKELEELVDEPGADELWPRDLRAAHDRLFAAKKLKEDASSIANFEAIAQKWAALEWSDGEICIRLPRCNNDLVAEGHTLHHCVGGYGKTHLQGKLVLFVRHARRPERSWYTLNIDTSGVRPRRIQLHGYGNEWAHGEKLQIPQRVLDFCDRWESEILVPVFASVKAEEARQQKKKKKGAA